MDLLLQKRSVLHLFVAGFLAVTIGTLLLVLVWNLPNGPVREHIQSSFSNIEARWGLEYFPDRENAVMDLRTDCRMLTIAAYDDATSSLDQAMGAYSLKSDGLGMEQLNLLRATLEKPEDAALDEYPRYWHGYLVPLRFELLFTDYYSILLYNGILIELLVTLLVYVLVHKRETALLPPLVVTLLLASPVTLAMSMQYYAVTFVTLIALIAFVWFKDRLSGFWGVAFFSLGMIVNYLDFLTFPLLALGPSLLLFLSLLDDRKSWQEQLACALVASSLWLVGYGLMWVSKWLLASVILHKNVVVDAAQQMAVRTSHETVHGYESLGTGVHITYADVLSENARRIGGTLFNKLLLAAYPVFFIVWLVGKKGAAQVSGFPVRKVPAILSVALLPFVWSLLMSNHTYTHASFVFRIFLVSVLAALYVPSYIVANTTEKRGNHAR